MSDINFLEKLLDGVDVDWRSLWEVTIWDKKFNAVERHKQELVNRYHYFLAKEINELAVPGGTVKLLTTNVSNKYTTVALASDKISSGEIVAIPWGGDAIVQYYNGDFLTSDNRIATSSNPEYLSNKYLYYFLLNNIAELRSYYRGSGIKHPSMYDVLEMKIPIPSLEIQAEIVRILDAFTAHTAELTAELTARKKQYNYYRDKLLSFEDGEVEWVSLESVISFINAKPHEKLVDPSGDIALMTSRFISTEGKFARYINSEDVLTPAFKNDVALVMSDLPNGRALAKTFYVDENNKYAANQRVCLLRVKDKNIYSSKFLHYMVNRNKQLLAYDSGVDQTHLKKGWILDIKIPKPSLEVQLRIVSVLDRFDILTRSYSVGLPREIELRQKQYEYYRDLLLSFPKPKEAAA